MLDRMRILERGFLSFCPAVSEQTRPIFITAQG
jgi:hypothetical protein